MDINVKMDLAGVRGLFRMLKKAGGDTTVMKGEVISKGH